MNLFGVDFPPLAVVMGSLVGAFIVGLGAGLGSQVGIYLFNKHAKRKLDRVSRMTRRIVKRIYARDHR